MKTLFKNFAVNVLDVEPGPLPMPKLPLPFAVFLEEEKEDRR